MSRFRPLSTLLTSLLTVPLAAGVAAAPAHAAGSPVPSPIQASGLVAPGAADYTGSASQVVLNWERTALRTVYTENAAPAPVGTPYLGFTALAVHDAVERAVRRGQTSAPAAAAVAAHAVLREYFPTSAANLDADLAASLAAISESPAKQRGLRVGARAAAAMVADRVDDGRNNTSIVYERDPAVGVWQPPATGMLAPWLGYTDLLVLRDRVDVDGPDPLDSAAYAADFEEVRRYGSAVPGDRLPEQTETAKFYSANPVPQLSMALVGHLESHPIGLRRTAKLFAAVHAAMADSIIQSWRAKYDEGFWRPFQAIPAAATDGNDATEAEEGWTPMVPTPPYSDYFSGHAAVTGSLAEVVRRMLGEDTALTVSSSVTSTTRSYSQLAEIEDEAFHARIWLGIHFRDAMDDGYHVAHTTARRVLRELR